MIPPWHNVCVTVYSVQRTTWRPFHPTGPEQAGGPPRRKPGARHNGSYAAIRWIFESSERACAVFWYLILLDGIPMLATRLIKSGESNHPVGSMMLFTPSIVRRIGPLNAGIPPRRVKRGRCKYPMFWCMDRQMAWDLF